MITNLEALQRMRDNGDPEGQRLINKYFFGDGKKRKAPKKPKRRIPRDAEYQDLFD